MIKAVIFDMDGLMFDTEKIYNLAWVYAGDRLGVKFTPEIYMSYKGCGREVVNRLQKEAFGEDFDVASCRRYRDDFLNKYVEDHGIEKKPGLDTLLKFLKDNGIKAGLATSTYKSIAQWYFDITGVEEYFTTKTFGDMVEHGKPAPDIFLMAAKMLKEDPADCLVLEDSRVGVKAGAASGCHVIMVPDLLTPTDEERKNADAILPSLNEVIGWIKESK